MRIEFFPLDVDHIINPAGKAVIRLFGRTTDGKRICVLDEHYEPYFYVITDKDRGPEAVAADIKKIKVNDDGRVVGITRCDVVKKKYLGNDVDAVKIYVQNPNDIHVLRDAVKKVEGVKERKEMDIQYARRYLIDKEITPLVACVAEGQEVQERLNVDIALKADMVQQSGDALIKNPRILAFDIEVYTDGKMPDEEKDPVIMASFFGNDGFTKVITWKSFSNPKKYISFAHDEGDLLLQFKETVHSYQPDYLVGYFSDGFDLPYLRTRAEKYHIKLDLGLDYSEVRHTKKRNVLSVKVKGIVHIDIYKFIRRVMIDILDVDNYDLDTVAKALLGEGKTEGVNIAHVSKAWNNDHEKLREFCEYNLNDAKLTLRLSNIMMPHLHEFVKLIGQPLYDVSRMTYGQFVEWYIIKHIKQFNEIIPNRPTYPDMMKRRFESYEGAFVYEPQPGLYNDIAVFDFRSLYPTIIVAHNICVSTITDSQEDAHETPEIMIDGKKQHFYFNYRRDGFFAVLLKDIIVRRNRIKEIIKNEEKKVDPVLNARQYSLKILANSFYGYIGFAGARWYNNACAASVTAYGRQYIKNLLQKAGAAGFQVIYSDTDSMFISLGGKTQKDAHDFLKEINRELPSLMELELENFYPRGIFVMKKGQTKGAKKKYALIDEQGNVKVVGFETVRGDWSAIAKEVQQHILEIILKEESKEKALAYVQEIIKQIRSREIPIEKMVIQKQLKKEIQDYTSVGPHVVVAKQLRERGEYIGVGAMIKYVIEEGNGIIRERAKPVDEAKKYDVEYYVNNQIIPSVKSIFEVLGIDKDLLGSSHTQSSLSDFHGSTQRLPKSRKDSR